MYLSKFLIKNFRTIRELDLIFNKGLNVLVGENNSGKTTILDALRICIGYGDMRRNLFVLESDFHIDRTNPTAKLPQIEFDLYFKIENENEEACFIDLLSMDESGNKDLQLHFRFWIDDKSTFRRVRYKVWGGEHEGQQITPEVLLLLFHVHLDALRDSEQNLRPVRGNKLGQLFSNLQIDATDDRTKKKELANKLHQAVNSDPEWSAHVSKGKEKINEHLRATSFSGREQNIDIDFLSFEFARLVENLKVRTPVYADAVLGGDTSKQRHFDLYQNGLGLNNLLYTATILGDLKQRKELEEVGFAALLIEEPEAHLHPQLQNLFFRYLNKLEPSFQIFISSHSPTITAKANLNSVIVLQHVDNNVRALSLSRSGLTKDNKEYLRKFLDVTKSQLFFANGVILVEGISEALLIHLFASQMGEEYDLEKAGVEVVNVAGVAFEHFGNLFNSDDEFKRLHSRCALLTDDDSSVADDDDEASSRANNAKALEKNNLRVFLIERTFEVALFRAGDNHTTLLDIFKEMHPKAAAKIVPDADRTTYAENFLKKVISNKAKSELAHRLAIKLADENELKKFTVPVRIQEAIRFVTKGESGV